MQVPKSGTRSTLGACGPTKSGNGCPLGNYLFVQALVPIGDYHWSRTPDAFELNAMGLTEGHVERLAPHLTLQDGEDVVAHGF
jgi:hypothetical protein